MEYKQIRNKFVFLLFPKSSDKKYKLFINDANQCEFLKHIIDNYEWRKKYYMNIVIPDDLYKDIRKIDIEYFIECLIGKSIITNFMLESDTEKYDFKKIAKLSQSLCTNEDLNFIKILDKYYPPYN